MGNSESKGESSKDPKSPHATPTRSQQKEKERPHDGQAHASRRQPRADTTSTTLANLTPTSTLGSTHGTLAASPSISTSEIHGHGATVSGSSHSRQRSITAGNRLKPDDIASSHKSDSSSIMGQEQSKRAPSRSATHPGVTPAEKERPTPSPEPVQVPRPHHEDFADKGGNLTPPGEATSPYGLPASQFDRPPRLPLPIERDPEPASPIISPTDISSPAEAGEDDGLRRRHSMLSSTTLDDDEGMDAATFNTGHDSSQPKIPTTIVWRYPAHQVFITGSFVDWQRKLKMQRNSQTGQHTIVLHLAPGTHHMKFLVDGEMKQSDEYPTTVDYTNALMNYLEIEPQPPAPAAPMPIPGAGAAQTAGRTAGSADVPPGTQVSETTDELSATLHETIVPGPGSASDGQTGSVASTQQQDQQPSKPPKKKLPRPKYTGDIPEMLLHLDLYNNPDDERYQRASKAMQNLPTPPTLPMFMQKSILNANTPHKDDASVLTMPNHTVLNHLATSSIRSGVLATSGTTRYKRKVRLFSPNDQTPEKPVG